MRGLERKSSSLLFRSHREVTQEPDNNKPTLQKAENRFLYRITGAYWMRRKRRRRGGLRRGRSKRRRRRMGRGRRGMRGWLRRRRRRRRWAYVGRQRVLRQMLGYGCFKKGATK